MPPSKKAKTAATAVHVSVFAGSPGSSGHVDSEASQARSDGPDVAVEAPQSTGKRTFRPIDYEHPRAVLLAVQIPTDTVLDSEGPALIAKIPGVWLRMQKLSFETEAITPDTYERAAQNIADAAAVPLPQSEITAIGLSCTSMSFVLGHEHVSKQLRSACPHAKTTDMATAQVAAITALGVKRVALVTPYIQELAVKNAAMLEKAGLTVVAHETMGLTHDSMTDKVSTATIKEWALAVDTEEAQALVIGCSALRACEPGFIDELEAVLGKPVVTSTQAFLWKLLRVAGISDQISGYGALFAKH